MCRLTGHILQSDKIRIEGCSKCCAHLSVKKHTLDSLGCTEKAKRPEGGTRAQRHTEEHLRLEVLTMEEGRHRGPPMLKKSESQGSEENKVRFLSLERPR